MRWSTVKSNLKSKPGYGGVPLLPHNTKEVGYCYDPPQIPQTVNCYIVVLRVRVTQRPLAR